MTRMELKEHLSLDSVAEIVGELNDSELLEASQAKRRRVEEEEDNEDRTQDKEETPDLSVVEQMKMVKHLRQFMQQHPLDFAENTLTKIEEIVFDNARNNRKQTKISDFFTNSDV